ncbi:ParB/RepB/Spo0J family partition protein [Natronospirillum operosum]|uniref:Probable chromosome-partitioning protein ParB n=1 Tax=Natronospirillum operosum TaxID=2759953 RepID=A0A4Z0WCE4_9GAMM|nr:ParB/RepB/Spo0J family partition protein [Natronospirillum operosum]TGG91473.1 ParB/RepB/Spo0J family partition protein [Natronospirillum operosum]
MASRKRGLGKGLSSLISQPAVSVEAGEHEPATPSADALPSTREQAPSDLRYLAIDQLQPGQYQPRRDMGPEGLEELAASIRSQGIIEPIVVRPITSSRFEIIAGERRWRAARMAGLEHIPAVIRSVSDEDAIAMALIENIQREDLNPVEEATALMRLQKEFDLTQQEVADIVGKNRATVANLLRLLNLSPEVRRMLEQGDLEMGHARALLSLSGDTQDSTAREVVARALNVRQTEQLVRQVAEGRAGGKKSAADKPAVDANIRKLEETLATRIGAPVAIQHKASGKGSLVIRYSNLDELDGILNHLK